MMETGMVFDFATTPGWRRQPPASTLVLIMPRGVNLSETVGGKSKKLMHFDAF